MKYFLTLLCALLALSPFSNLHGATADPKTGSKATVEKVTGSAHYTDASGMRWEVRQGMNFQSGAMITTGKKSTVVLYMGPNAGKILIEEESTLAIDKLDIQRTGAERMVQASLDVKKGSILGNVPKLSKVSSYEVKTANGVAAIRGTGFRVFAIGVFQCANGQLIVTISAPGQPPRGFTVNAGQGVDGRQAAPTVQPLSTADVTYFSGLITPWPQPERRPVRPPLPRAEPRLGDHPNPPPQVERLRELLVQEAREQGLTEAQAMAVANAYFAQGYSTGALFQGVRLDDRYFETIFEAVLSPVHGHLVP